MNKYLKIGRASAGSGKTFTLTTEYISLLIADPMNYKRILAVTFTNKATNEMKTRITETLHGVAVADTSTKDYMKRFREKFPRKSELEIRDLCRKALTLILHDYSHFRIETIDSFFQSVVRDLARELNLTANLRVDIDQKTALAEAVAKMIENMKRGDSVYKAVLAYVSDMLETESRNWQINDEVTKFSANIFSEKYLKAEKQLKAKTDNADFFSTYKTRLYKYRTILAEDKKACGENFQKICDDNGLNTKDFVKGNSGIFGYMMKVKEGRDKDLPKCMLDNYNAAWLKDDTLNEQFHPQFIKIYDQIVEIRKKNATITAIFQTFNQMNLLGMVDKALRNLNEENNRFILADTAHKLNEIINDNDVPFIYEKMGTTFRYIMIDEFQDTSELQWKNFQPLIKESLSNGHTCLLVGDVKQSIYRFRNSDWSILNGINDNQDLAPYIEEEEMRRNLDTNYRSEGNIVDFNNRFFKAASQCVAEKYMTTYPDASNSSDIVTAYNEVSQKIKKGNENKGFVNIIELTSPNETEKNTKDAEVPKEDNMLQTITDTVIALKAKGVKDSDIAILVRVKGVIKPIIDHLKANIPGVKAVSSEAFLLESSKAIQLIILALRVISGFNREEYESDRQPFNKFLCATLAMRYQQISSSDRQIDNISKLYQASTEELSSYLPEGFLKGIDELQVLPLFELCERLSSMFNLDTIQEESPYIFCFMDYLASFVAEKSSDIDTFINYWNENLHDKAIQAERADGIQLMTIHKSKGLAFHTVIVPYCNWTMGIDPKKNNMLWCESSTDNMTELPVTPIIAKSELRKTAFSHDLEAEELKSHVDNLNLMYVAFTRTKKNLIVISRKPKASGYSAYDTLDATMKKLKEENGGEEIQMPIGEIIGHDEKDKYTDQTIEINYTKADFAGVFRQSNRSLDFVASADEDNNELSYISKGLVVHKIFEMITNLNDIPQAMRTLEQEGVFQDESFHDEVQTIINRAINTPCIREWFDPKWNVMNECGIITIDDSISGKNPVVVTRRPDRVIYNEHETIVIDYKTGQKLSRHKKQVGSYMAHLRKMGMPDVKGFLWYMSNNEVEPV